MDKQETIVFCSSWDMGHLIPMVELAKLFTTTTTFSIAILIFDAPFDLSTTIDPFITKIASSHPSISFHRLPKPSIPPNHLSDGRHPFSFDLLRFINPQLSDFLTSFSPNFSIRALILDMFCSTAIDVARDLRLPAYIFFSGNVSALTTFIAVPTIHSQIDFKDPGKTKLPISRLPPIPASYLPIFLLDREGELGKALLNHFELYPKADGIIVNTFEAIEPKVVKAIEDGLYGPLPPVYCIGPLIAKRNIKGDEHACLKWLDEQPKGSVVFLCFGSMGTFPTDQVKETAVGLERSGHRFLWVVRSSLGRDTTENRLNVGSITDPNLEEMLPKGFMERTKERGMVVKSWAPQMAVLEHEAVGAFVSHCGWNSTLEAMSAGVAMIAWPMYAEQKMNKVVLVEAARVAVEMEGWEEVVVKGEEVEKKVRWLMETEEGRELKERARAMRDSALEARMKGGSSDVAWMNFVNGI